MNTATSPSIDTAKSAFADLRHLPALPDSAAQVVSVMTDEFATLEDVARIIEHDPALTARVLGLANSALYGQRTEIVSVREAIIRVLGLDLTRGIALGIAVGQIFDTNRCPAFSKERFWKDSLYLATVCSRLFRAVGETPEQRGIGFTAGSISGIGLLVIAVTQPEALQVALTEQGEADLGSALQESIGFDHRTAGMALAELWELPDVLAHVIGFAGIDDFDGPHASVVGLVSLAKEISRHLNDDEAEDEPESLRERANQLGVGDTLDKLLAGGSDSFDYVEELVALIAS